MSFTTSAGTTVALSAGTPATYNQAGYEALTFTTIGEVTDLGELPSKVFTMVQHQPVAERGMKKKKGGFDLGNQTLQFALDADDAGQILAEAAADSDAEYAVQISHPTLGDFYAQALVADFKRALGDVNSASNGSVMFHYVIAADGSTFTIVPAA